MAYKAPKEAGAVCPGLFWLANRTHIKKNLGGGGLFRWRLQRGQLRGVAGCFQPGSFIALALGHHPVGEPGAAGPGPQFLDLKPGGLPLHIDPVAVIVELDKDLHGVPLVDGDGFQEQGVQGDTGLAALKLPFAEVFKPDLRTLLGLELPLALRGGDDGIFRAVVYG
jgi:hypothetical protein